MLPKRKSRTKLVSATDFLDSVNGSQESSPASHDDLDLLRDLRALALSAIVAHCFEGAVEGLVQEQACQQTEMIRTSTYKLCNFPALASFMLKSEAALAMSLPLRFATRKEALELLFGRVQVDT